MGKFQSAKEDLSWVVGEYVREARIVAGLSQSQLARKISSTQPGIARLESGSGLPSLTTLLKIATAIKTDLLPPRFASIPNPIADKYTFFAKVNSSPAKNVEYIALSSNDMTIKYEDRETLVDFTRQQLVN